MASNSGTGLIIGNRKQNQLCRASKAVYQPQKHGISEIIDQKCSDIILSVSLTSTIINQRASEQFILGDASSPKVRIDDAMSPIRDKITQKIRSDAQYSNFRNTMTFDTKHRRK